MSADYSYLSIGLYIFLWTITFYLYQRKRHFDAGTILIGSYLLFAIFSLFLWVYRKDINGVSFLPLTIFPFLYLYFALLISTMPVLLVDMWKINVIKGPSRRFIYLFAIFYVSCTLLQLPPLLPRFVSGLSTILFDIYGGQDIYNEVMDQSKLTLNDGVISNLPAIFSNCLSEIGILCFYYSLTWQKKNYWLSIGLGLGSFFTMILPIAQSQRGPFMDILATFIIGYFAFRRFLSNRVNNVIKKIGLISIILLSIPFIAITISRFADKDGGSVGSVFRYAGEANLNFNNYALDDNGIRYGDRVVPVFKKMLGWDNVPNNFWERRDKYPFLYIGDEVFVTFVGDFAIDFGPYLAFVIFIIFYIFARSKTRINTDEISFEQLLLLFFIMCVCIQGGMKLFTFADLGNLRIITFILFSLAIKFNKDREYVRVS